jgi:hypothetical protein
MLRWRKHRTEKKARCPGADRRAVIEAVEGRVLMSATPVGSTVTFTYVVTNTYPAADISPVGQVTGCRCQAAR